MRNKVLALSADFIPYVKELRKLTGSVTASILMQQLDFRFYQKPEGFYKFQAPCKNTAYKQGDSWSEELGFSVEEFRTAFDKIGLRHESKTAYDAAEDAFIDENGKEYFYACYHDRISGLTYYFRNHDLLDRALDDLFTEKKTKKPASRKPTIPVYVNQQSRLTETNNLGFDIKNTEITTERERDAREAESARAPKLALVSSVSEPTPPDQPFSPNDDFRGALPAKEWTIAERFVLKSCGLWDDLNNCEKPIVETNWKTKQAVVSAGRFVAPRLDVKARIGGTPKLFLEYWHDEIKRTATPRPEYVVEQWEAYDRWLIYNHETHRRLAA